MDRFAETAREAAARLQAVAPGIAAPPVRMPEASQRQRSEPAPPPARTISAAPVPDGDAVADARAVAAAAATLDDLRAALERFEGCNLRATARRVVFADGNPQASIMLIGEAPGRDEDEQGLPFVGRSGQLLDRMLAAIGLDRTQVYIANVVPWRPPGNRTPTPQETEICRPFITRQIELVAPKLLVFLGGASAATLAGTTEGILKLRGRWLSYQAPEGPIPAIATLHPAYLLRSPLQKRLAWRDFRALRQRIDQIVSSLNEFDNSFLRPRDYGPHRDG